MSLKYAIALSGGIGSGKSTVASFLKLYGYEVICADEISHKVLLEQKQSVLETFGDGILDENKEISRSKLGEIVFSDETKRKELEAILHPKIREKILELAENSEKKGVFYFIDIPLFFETNAYPIKNSLLISTTKELQIKRLKKRNNLDPKDALKRIEAQMPMEQKKKLATFIIENNDSLEALQAKIEQFLNESLNNLQV